ncbi:response regulator [Pontiellaceae bacterium B1224]|nr:response regulator [Pontiellaceae bacterium B1224]
MHTTSPVQILIVDDDAHFRAAQKRNLHRMNLRPESRAQVLEASSGKEAMEVLKRQNVDCILLDHNMPGGSGMNWLKHFLGINSNLAIVMLTGQGSEQLAVEAMKNGAMDYLVKGAISRDDLERAVLNALEKVELHRTINLQQEQLLDAERQRVMIESLGTACHHIGQPATVISAYLQLMQAQETDAGMQEMIASCLQASETMVNLLQQLQHVSKYRTTPYLPANEQDSTQIINIEP